MCVYFTKEIVSLMTTKYLTAGLSEDICCCSVVAIAVINGCIFSLLLSSSACLCSLVSSSVITVSAAPPATAAGVRAETTKLTSELSTGLYSVRWSTVLFGLAPYSPHE